MKKTILLLITISLSLILIISGADAEWGTQSLNAGEIEASVFSMLAGDGYTMSLDPLFSFDEINSRLITINDEWIGHELVIMVRISETEVYYWPLALTSENLILARIALSEDAPFCYVVFYQNGDVAETASYIKSLDSISPYDDFKSNADRIFNSLAFGNIAEEESSKDPVLSLFPGIRWGMTRKEMISEYGEEAFSAMGLNETGMASKQTILGDEVLVVFSCTDGKLKSIGLMGIGDIADQLIETYNDIYGEMKRVSYMDALMGDYKESNDADCNLWISDKTIILITDSKNLVQYKPRY